MRLFFDTNVLLDSAYLRAGYVDSEAAIAKCLNKVHEGWMAWHSLSNIYYLVRAQTKSQAKAQEFVNDILVWADVANTGKAEALAAISYGMTDFEDAMQVAAAAACGADFILTRNLADFATSSIPAMSPETFLALHP